MLRSRERAILILGGAAAALVLLVVFAVIPGVSKVTTLSRASSLAERELADVRGMRPELTRLDQEVRPKAARVAATANRSEATLSRLTAALQEAGFPPSAVSLKSAGTRDGEYFSEESFDLKVDNITYLEALSLLSRLENGPLPVVVRTAQFKSRYDDSRYLDATLRLGFLKPSAK